MFPGINKAEWICRKDNLPQSREDRRIYDRNWFARGIGR